MRARVSFSAFGIFAILTLFTCPLSAQVAKQTDSELDQLVRVSQRLALAPEFVALEEAPVTTDARAVTAFEVFLATAGGTWSADVDARSGFIGAITGSGLAWIPGRGNDLKSDAIAELLAGKSEPDLSVLERKARLEAPKFATMFGFDPDALKLNLDRSGIRRRMSCSSTSMSSPAATWSRVRGSSSPSTAVT